MQMHGIIDMCILNFFKMLKISFLHEKGIMFNKLIIIAIIIKIKVKSSNANLHRAQLQDQACIRNAPFISLTAIDLRSFALICVTIMNESKYAAGNTFSSLV